MSTNLKLVNVVIEPHIRVVDNNNLTRVAFVYPNGQTKKDFVELYNDNFTDVLKKDGFNDKDKTYVSVKRAFDVAENYRKNSLLFGVNRKEDKLEAYLEEQFKKNQFGFLFLIDTIYDNVALAPIITFCEKNHIFLVCYYKEKDIVKSDFLILIRHNQAGKENITLLEDTGEIAEQLSMILPERLSINPNFNTLDHYIGLTGIKDNVFNIAERTTLQNNHVNQYFDISGISLFRIGTVTSGKKIEEVFCIYNFIPYDLEYKINQWKNDIKPRRSELMAFKMELESLLDEYEVREILYKSSKLGNKSYTIDKVEAVLENGFWNFVANISICYNDNIVFITVRGKQVDE